MKYRHIVVREFGGPEVLEVVEDELRVPGFGYLGGDLLLASATGGVYDRAVAAYVDSILAFVGEDERLAGLREHRLSTGVYPTTEANVLERCPPQGGCLSSDEGLRLVLEACDELEARASGVSQRRDELVDAS